MGNPWVRNSIPIPISTITISVVGTVKNLTFGWFGKVTLAGNEPVTFWLCMWCSTHWAKVSVKLWNHFRVSRLQPGWFKLTHQWYTPYLFGCGVVWNPCGVVKTHSMFNTCGFVLLQPPCNLVKAACTCQLTWQCILQGIGRRRRKRRGGLTYLYMQPCESSLCTSIEVAAHFARCLARGGGGLTYPSHAFPLSLSPPLVGAVGPHL